MEYSPNPVDAAREVDFDQSVDEQKQLEQELERKPENERLQERLDWVKEHLKNLLAELDKPIEAAPETQQAVGQAAVEGATYSTYNAANEVQNTNAPGETFIDRRGGVHFTAEERNRANEE